MKTNSLVSMVLLLMTSACSSIDSENIPTDSMTANVKIAVDEYGTTNVRATLRVEDSALTYLDLTGGEHLTASMDGRTTTLSPGFFDYHGVLSEGLPGSQVRVALRRTQYADAQNTTAVLPSPFALRVSALPNEYDDSIRLRWNDRTREKTRVKVDGHCVRDEEWELNAWNDTGELRLSMSQLPIKSHWSGGVCTLEIRVERCRDGRIDPGFYAGSIEACQVRKDYIDIYR